MIQSKLTYLIRVTVYTPGWSHVIIAVKRLANLYLLPLSFEILIQVYPNRHTGVWCRNDHPALENF